MSRDDERLRRWRLVLGGDQAEGTGCVLSAVDQKKDDLLSALYDEERTGGLGGSAPSVARWLGDIREMFSNTVVQIMQKDALERLDLKQILLEPELLESVQPDVHLVSTLLALKDIIPARTRETARLVVRKVVEDLERRLSAPLQQAVKGSLDRAARTWRPRHNEIDWNRTIRANLQHYLPEYRTIIPHRLAGYARRRGAALREIILCIDQSGSMATSVIYAGVFGAVLASLRSIRTRVVVFDTSVVDLTEELQDPVELLFGVQLGGGTDINRALAYCQELIVRPRDTILVLLSDLYEGGNREEMLRRVGSLVRSGVQLVALLALSDRGAPSFDHRTAEAFAGLGVPAFACTPDQFPSLMAAAIERRDIGEWAAAEEIKTAA